MRYLLFLFLFSFSSFTLAKTESLTVAWSVAPRTIDPRYGIDAQSQYLSDLIQCSLITFDQSGQRIPYLASSWEWVNPKHLRLHLRDAKFSDGTPVRAEDVLATYRFLMQKKMTPSPLSGSFAKVQAVTAPTAKTVEFTLHTPDASFVDNLFVGILPEKLASKDIIHDEKQLLGCGAFRLSKVEMEQYELTRNEHYSLGALSKLPRILIKVVKDESTCYAKLLKGEVDLVQNGIGRDQLKSIVKNAKLSIQEHVGLNVSYIGFNFRDPLLAKQEVRQAISLAVNREEIITYLLQGGAESAHGFFSKQSPYYRNFEYAHFDPQRANALLDQAGFSRKGKEQKRFDLVIKTSTDVTKKNIAQAIAGQLHKVGIRAMVQSQEWGKFMSDVEKGAVQIWTLNWIGYKDPDILRYVFASESFPPHGANRGWYQSAQVDKLLDQAQQLHEIPKRQALYDEAQKLLDADTPYVFLWHDKNVAVYDKSVKGFHVYADGRYSSLREVYRE